MSSRLFDSPAKEQSQTFLFHYIGRGLGLTPAGDDFTIGLLAVDSLTRFLPNGFRQVLKETLAAKRTTDISESYLHCAMEGYFSSAVINVMMNIDKLCLDTMLKKLASSGSTSGNDTIAGVLCGLLHIQSQAIN